MTKSYMSFLKYFLDKNEGLFWYYVKN